MSTSGKWKFCDRLTNDEFTQLLPHIELEHVLLTQVLISNSKWIHLYDANIQKSFITCSACGRTVEFVNAKKHLFQNDHQLALISSINQYYHPFFTYGKGDVELARGQCVAESTRKRALLELNMQMKSFKKDCLMAKHIAEIIQRQERKKEDEDLIALALNDSIAIPDEMFVKASVPFEDMSKLLYCIDSGEWNPAVVYKKLVKNSNFHCSLCSINCSGIDTLNAHLGGYTHRKRQLQIVGLRYEACSEVTKNCVIHFTDSFSFSIHEKANIFFKDKIKCRHNTEFGLKYIGLTSEQKIKLNELYELIPNTMKSDKRLRISNTKIDAIYGHIGVEYVLQIIKSEKDKDPMFECGLCEFFGDVTRMQRHLLNYDHRKKYLEIHYPATVKKYEIALGHMRFMEFRGVMGEIIDKVSIEIEREYGRAAPYTVTANDYQTRRGDLIADVYSLLHATQVKGPSFSNVVTSNEMSMLKDRSIELAKKRHKSLIKPVFIKPHIGIIYMNKNNNTNICTVEESENIPKNVPCRRNRSMSASPSIYTDVIRNTRCGRRKRSRSPNQDVCSKWEDYIRNQKHHNIWDIYRREIAVAANEIEVVYVQYRSNPESHPMYEKEWNNFWHNRKKELERNGVNHRAYNFQPEWVQYFKQRIEILFGEALHKSKTDIRQNLEIPLDAEEDCQRTNVPADETYNLDIHEREHMYSNFGQVREVIPKTRRLDHAEFSSGSLIKKIAKDRNLEIVSNLKDDHTRVVHVLRLITALEDHLGSLGSKIMHLLSKALEMEKHFDGNNLEFEAKILTASNCKILEMSMEKLKGILFAGLLDEKKTIGFHRIIQFTSELLNYAEKMGWRSDISKEPITYSTQDAIQKNNNVCMPNEKSLSDTLIDLVGSQRNQHIDLSKGSFYSAIPVACPPPPTIGSNSITNIYKCRAIPSGLASFDTKLSIDELPSQHFRQPIGSGGNNFDNSSFNSKNNSVRTNVRSNITQRIIGSNVKGGNNKNNGSFNNMTTFPNIIQNNVINRGVAEINRSTLKWKHWINMN